MTEVVTMNESVATEPFTTPPRISEFARKNAASLRAQRRHGACCTENGPGGAGGAMTSSSMVAPGIRGHDGMW
jgi:hypothetical protein